MIWEREDGIPEGFHDRLLAWVVKELEEHKVQAVSLEMNVRREPFNKVNSRVETSIVIQIPRKTNAAPKE